MYVKLFDTILRSTVWMLPAPHVKVWITFLLIADSNGYVRCSVPGLAKEAGVTLEECRSAIAALEAPDPDSQSKGEGGRRILRLSEGEPVWFVVNYDHYRNLRDTGARQEYMRNYMRDYRTRKGDVAAVNPGVNSGETRLAQAEANAKNYLAAPKGKPGATSAPSSKATTRGTRQKPRGNPDIPALVKFYEAEFARTRGQVPVVRYGVAGKSFQALLAGRTLDQAKGIVTDFLERPPQFYADRALADPQHVVQAANTVLARRRE